MLNLLLLESDDIIEATDWIRPLRLVSMSGGVSDSYSFTSCYSGTPENNVKWVQVCDALGPVWKGKTLGQLNALYVPTNRASSFTAYEVVRGNVPFAHRLDITFYNSYADLWR